MGRLIKWLFYLLVLGFLALVVYAYIGPILGADFGPEQFERRMPVELNDS